MAPILISFSFRLVSYQFWSPIQNDACAGLTEVKVFRDHANPNLVSMLFAVDNLAKAKALVESPGLKAHMESVGVVGPMSARFLKEDVWTDIAGRPQGRPWR